METKVLIMVRYVKNYFDLLRLKFKRKKKSRLYVAFRKPSTCGPIARRPITSHIRLVSKGAMGILVFMFQLNFLFGQQQDYDNFEGKKFLHYNAINGVLDSAIINPAKSYSDSSVKCAMYIRNSTKKFDNIKMSLPGKLTGVEQYATYLGNPPQLKIKIYTTAPIGTLIEILLGSNGRNNEYPAGTHSQYQAYTTTTNAWEELEFKFSQIPDGSETTASQIDQITLLFNPNSNTSDTYYFDDLTGPILIPDQTTSTNTPTEAEKKQKH